MIEITDLQKSFGNGADRRIVIDHLNVCFEPNKVNFLVGPSGSGKTTLISLAGAMQKADGGRIRVFEHEITSMDAVALDEFRSRRVGFMFQQYHLFNSLTAAENVGIGLLPLGISWHNARKRTKSILEQLELTDSMDRRCSELSGGQQQRIVLARALVKAPRVLFCDEPTAALDPENGCRVLQLIRDHALANNRVVVIVTHDSRIFHMADCIYEISKGKIKRREK